MPGEEKKKKKYASNHSEMSQMGGGVWRIESHIAVLF